jgi:hypothetical protein
LLPDDLVTKAEGNLQLAAQMGLNDNPKKYERLALAPGLKSLLIWLFAGISV